MTLMLSMALAQVLDATREVPMAGGEHLALGRTGIGMAAGPKGLFQNPVAPAIRAAESQNPWSIQATASMSTVVEASGVDLGSVGLEDRWSGTDALVGGSLTWRNGGGGYVVSRSGRSAGGSTLVVRESHATGAWNRRDGCCAFGVGYRGLAVTGPSWSYDGRGLEMGALFFEKGLNIGLVARTPVVARSDEELPEGLPETAVMPLELGLGVAWRGLGPWTGLPTRFALDVVVRAPTEGLSQEAMVFGLTGEGPAVWTVGPRAGLELEPVPERLRLRSGAWVQAPELSFSAPAMHLTGGFELKLARLHLRGWERDLAVATAFDVSRDYREVSWLSVGFWDSGQVGVPWTPSI